MPRIKPKFVRTTSTENELQSELPVENPKNIPMVQFLREDPAEDTQARMLSVFFDHLAYFIRTDIWVN